MNGIIINFIFGEIETFVICSSSRTEPVLPTPRDSSSGDTFQMISIIISSLYE